MSTRKRTSVVSREKRRIRKQFVTLSNLRVHPPRGTLLDELAFAEHLDEVFATIKAARTTRQIVLEAWLIVDHLVTYFLRDGLGLPERINSDLDLLPWTFDRKLTMLTKLIRAERDKLPNQRSYLAFEFHPEFHDMLVHDHAELYDRIMEFAQPFEAQRNPEPSISMQRGNFNHSRFVPEWWFERAARLDEEWFKNCRRLNKARNDAAHQFRLDDRKLFEAFGVASQRDLKAALIRTVKVIAFDQSA